MGHDHRVLWYRHGEILALAPGVTCSRGPIKERFVPHENRTKGVTANSVHSSQIPGSDSSLPSLSLVISGSEIGVTPPSPKIANLFRLFPPRAIVGNNASQVSHKMHAFVSSTGVLGSNTSRFVASRHVCAQRTPVSQPRRSVAMIGDSIDFGKVDIASAGESLAGLVFTPERGNGTTTRCDLTYTPEQEAALNRHINVEYTAMYAYHAIWAYFDRDTVALPGFAEYFNRQSVEEREHAEQFMKYQNKRGGIVELLPVAVPEMKFTQEDGTSDAVYAMDMHLQLEKFVYYKLMDLHKTAGDANDPAMQDFIEGHLCHQIDSVKTAADYVAQLKRVGTPHGVYHFDLNLKA